MPGISVGTSTVYMFERQLEEKLNKKIRELGGLPLKFTSPGHVGVPDRIILMPNGRIYFVEMKRHRGKKVLDMQKYTFEKFEEMGFKVYILDSMREIEKFIKVLEDEQ